MISSLYKFYIILTSAGDIDSEDIALALNIVLTIAGDIDNG